MRIQTFGFNLKTCIRKINFFICYYFKSLLREKDRADGIPNNWDIDLSYTNEMFLGVFCFCFLACFTFKVF